MANPGDPVLFMSSTDTSRSPHLKITLRHTPVEASLNTPKQELNTPNKNSTPACHSFTQDKYTKQLASKQLEHARDHSMNSSTNRPCTRHCAEEGTLPKCIRTYNTHS